MAAFRHEFVFNEDFPVAYISHSIIKTVYNGIIPDSNIKHRGHTQGLAGRRREHLPAPCRTQNTADPGGSAVAQRLLCTWCYVWHRSHSLLGPCAEQRRWPESCVSRARQSPTLAGPTDWDARPLPSSVGGRCQGNAAGQLFDLSP